MHERGLLHFNTALTKNAKILYQQLLPIHHAIGMQLCIQFYSTRYAVHSSYIELKVHNICITLV